MAEENEKKKTYKAVNILSSKGESAIVEWVSRGRAYRKIVPLKEVKSGKMDNEILDKCPDYGIPWSKEIDPSASANDVEIALQNAGIWTPEDVFKNPGAIIGALNAAYKTDLAAILQTAKKYKNKE